MADNLPYLTAALICEKVLEDKDGTLSAIRIVDRVQFELPAEKLSELEKSKIRPGVGLDALIALKSGPFKGKGVLEIIIERPSGKRNSVAKHEFEFHGGDHGHNLRLNFALGIEEEGVHWFDVNFDGRLLTRIPLMLVRREPNEPQKPSATSGSA